VISRVQVYVNGRICDAGTAGISPFDTGFLLGYGVFETMRACAGRVFRLGRHLERLRAGCRLLGIEPVPEFAELRSAVEATLRANGLREARLRCTVTAGVETVPGAGPSAVHPTVVVAAWPVPKLVSAHSPWTAGTSARPVFSRDPLLSVKTTSRVGHVLARRQARAAGYDEALLVNESGTYTEGSVTNLFVLRAGVLLTPPVTDGLLPGLARELVLELAAGRGLKVQERSIAVRDLSCAEEAFLTNAVLGVVPLVAVDGRPVAGGLPGPVTVSLGRAFAAAVAAECAPVPPTPPEPDMVDNIRG